MSLFKRFKLVREDEAKRVTWYVEMPSHWNFTEGALEELAEKFENEILPGEMEELRYKCKPIQFASDIKIVKVKVVEFKDYDLSKILRDRVYLKD